MKYKYHYLIKLNGTIYDTAKDLLELNIIKNWLLKFRGLSRYKEFSFEKKRISLDDWKARFER